MHLPFSLAFKQAEELQRPFFYIKLAPPHSLTADQPRDLSLAASAVCPFVLALLMGHPLPNCMSSCALKHFGAWLGKCFGVVSYTFGSLLRGFRCIARPACPHGQCRSPQERACAGTTAPASGARRLQYGAAQHTLVMVGWRSWPMLNSWSKNGVLRVFTCWTGLQRS